MKAIWFRTPKTASTSIRVALLGFNTRNFVEEFDVTNHNRLHREGEKKFTATDLLRIMSDNFPLSDFPGKYLAGDFPRDTHICQVNSEQWCSYRDRYREFFDDAYKFSQCRHPLSRFVSSYNYTLKHDFEFKKALSMLLDGSAKTDWSVHDYHHTRPQTDILPMYDDKLLLDKLMRLESLQSDFDHVCTHLGIPRLKLLHTRKSTSKEVSKHYTEYYDSESEAMAREYFKKDFDILGYK
tara:strand:- start:646 stop:1362 length:717 start_codon:yes stop_codon:yes gene_type:complete